MDKIVDKVIIKKPTKWRTPGEVIDEVIMDEKTATLRRLEYFDKKIIKMVNTLIPDLIVNTCNQCGRSRNPFTITVNAYSQDDRGRTHKA